MEPFGSHLGHIRAPGAPWGAPWNPQVWFEVLKAKDRERLIKQYEEYVAKLQAAHAKGEPADLVAPAMAVRGAGPEQSGSVPKPKLKKAPKGAKAKESQKAKTPQPMNRQAAGIIMQTMYGARPARWETKPNTTEKSTTQPPKMTDLF